MGACCSESHLFPSQQSAVFFLMKPKSAVLLPYNFLDRVSCCLCQERNTHSIIFSIGLKIICLKSFPTVTFKSVCKVIVIDHSISLQFQSCRTSFPPLYFSKKWTWSLNVNYLFPKNCSLFIDQNFSSQMFSSQASIIYLSSSWEHFIGYFLNDRLNAWLLPLLLIKWSP